MKRSVVWFGKKMHSGFTMLRFFKKSVGSLCPPARQPEEVVISEVCVTESVVTRTV